MRSLFSSGADKIVINTEAVRRPEFITEAAKLFGSQAVVISIDAKKRPLKDMKFISTTDLNQPD